MGKKKNLGWQAQRMITSKFTPGIKRHDEKRRVKEEFFKEHGRMPSATEIIVPNILSYGTKDTYVKEVKAYARWVEKIHPVKFMDQAKGYVAEYLQSLQARGLAVDSLRTARSAIAKMYSIPSREFGFKMPKHYPDQATKGRKVLEKDEWMERLHGDKIHVMESIGLRRHEAVPIRVEQITADYKHIEGIIGKGGRVRYINVLNPELLKKYVESKSLKEGDKLFNRVEKGINVHRTRRSYAETMYLKLLEDKYEKGEKTSEYYLKRDGSGRKYDKEMLRIVSQNLGHNRERVVVESYLSFNAGFACK